MKERHTGRRVTVTLLVLIPWETDLVGAQTCVCVKWGDCQMGAVSSLFCKQDIKASLPLHFIISTKRTAFISVCLDSHTCCSIPLLPHSQTFGFYLLSVGCSLWAHGGIFPLLYHVVVTLSQPCHPKLFYSVSSRLCSFSFKYFRLSQMKSWKRKE